MQKFLLSPARWPPPPPGALRLRDERGQNKSRTATVLLRRSRTRHAPAKGLRFRRNLRSLQNGRSLASLYRITRINRVVKMKTSGRGGESVTPAALACFSGGLVIGCAHVR